MDTRGDMSPDEATGMWLEEWTAGSTASSTSTATNTGDGLGLPGGSPPTAVWTPGHMLGFPPATRTRTATPSPAVDLHMTWDDEESTTRIWTDAEYAMSASMLGRLGLPPIDEEETPARRASAPAHFNDAAERSRQAMHEKARMASSRATQQTVRLAPARQPAPPPARRHAKTLSGVAGPQPTPFSRPAPTWQPAPPAAANPTLRARPMRAPAPAQQLRPAPMRAPSPSFSTTARTRPAPGPRSNGLSYWVRCVIAAVALFAGVLLARLLLPDVEAPAPMLRGTPDAAAVVPAAAPVSSISPTVAQPVAPAPFAPTQAPASAATSPSVQPAAKPARTWHWHRPAAQPHETQAAADLEPIPSSKPSKPSRPSKQAAEPSTPQPAAAEKPEKARPAAAGFGTLRINSRPWAQVYVDGKLLGTTPQMNLIVPAGHHTVELINPPMEMSKKFSVDVAADEVVTKILNLIE